jgi:hypothetical protein
VIEEDLIHYFAGRAVSIFVNLALTLLFFFMRQRGEKAPLTESQRWVLTLLTWVFLLNTLTLISEFPMAVARANNDLGIEFYLTRVRRMVDFVIGMCLLLIGFVYPRPYLTWNRLRVLIYVILFVAFALLIVQLVTSTAGDQFLWEYGYFGGYAYLFGWFVPVLIWLPHYEKESSGSARMVLTLFIWSLLANPFLVYTNKLAGVSFITYDYSISFVIGSALYLYVSVRLLIILWKMRGSWAVSEWMNVASMGFFGLMAIVWLVVGNGDQSTVLETPVVYIVGHLPWAIFRPGLFAFAILKYQLFGPSMKVEKPVRFLMAGTGSLATFAILQRFSFGLEFTASLVLAGVVAAVLFFPFFRISEKIVTRFLPMTSQEEHVTLQEKRATYLISLQTAVIEGTIDTDYDQEALAEQRAELGISDREHELLMDSFAAREKPVAGATEVKELYLINTDGRPMVHMQTKAGDSDVSKVPEKDKDIMAGMLIAIHDYVQEGLKGGSTGRTSLDTIKYGDYALLIETLDRLVLALVVRGPDNPDLRQGMRDNLMLLKKRYGDVLIKWNGDLDQVTGAENDLKKFFAEFAHEKKDI